MANAVTAHSLRAGMTRSADMEEAARQYFGLLGVDASDLDGLHVHVGQKAGVPAIQMTVIRNGKEWIGRGWGAADPLVLLADSVRAFKRHAERGASASE